jgi:hypothetical protein
MFVLTHRNPIHRRKIGHRIVPIKLVACEFHGGLNCGVIWQLGARVEVTIELVHHWNYRCDAG